MSWATSKMVLQSSHFGEYSGAIEIRMMQCGLIKVNVDSGCEDKSISNQAEVDSLAVRHF